MKLSATYSPDKPEELVESVQKATIEIVRAIVNEARKEVSPRVPGLSWSGIEEILSQVERTKFVVQIKLIPKAGEQ